MEELTDRQRALLDFLGAFQKQNGYPPTLAQMANHLGVSSLTGIRGHLAALERKGCIHKAPGASRAVVVKGWKKLLNATVGRVQGRHGASSACGSVTYYLGWLTRGRKPLLARLAVEDIVERTIREISADHGWTIEELTVEDDRIFLRITVSPDHSPAAVVQHFQWFAGWERLKRFGLSGLRGLWSSGFAAGTDRKTFNKALKELEQA